MARCKQPPPKSALENRQEANKITALIVPAILIGIVGYVTWIVVVVLSGEFTESDNRT
jgi:palmitoyltransferase